MQVKVIACAMDGSNESKVFLEWFEVKSAAASESDCTLREDEISP